MANRKTLEFPLADLRALLAFEEPLEADEEVSPGQRAREEKDNRNETK